MINIANVSLPMNKKVFVSLTYIFGIGKQTALKICKILNISLLKNIKDLSFQEIECLRKVVKQVTVEEDLKRKIKINIQQLIKINSYRGYRHTRRLPSRGQKTKTNAKTVKRGLSEKFV